MRPEKRWTIKPVDETVVSQLSEQLKINPILCRALVARGVRDYESARHFFRPELSHLHDPFLMKDMRRAVDRITLAAQRKERIIVYGDYDVDGTTAVSLMYTFLKQHYPADVVYYVPHRYREGYGISKAGMDFAADNGFHLVIALDCGIKSVDMIAYAATKGIDVIVCDHHQPDDQLPIAHAILNPKQRDCPYPYKELSGCGIGFKLACGLAMHWNIPPEQVYTFLDLTAISIASDIVPIDGENRVLAFYGIKRINESPCLAIATLKELAGVNRHLSVSDLVFVIGPRINAAGRMDDARKAVEFFIETDADKIQVLAAALHTDNDDRKEVDKSITEEALGMIRDSTALQQRKSTVLYQPHWHKGVVGIVASRLIDHFYRPTIVLASSNDKVSGSARSVAGFNIYEAIHACSDLLENYGGHFFAAGLTISPDKVQAFADRFEQVVAERITPAQMCPEIEIDGDIPVAMIRQPFYNIIKQFEPFGPANMKPVFVSRGMVDYQGNSRVVKDAHLRLVAHQGSSIVVEGIGFNMADKYEIVANGRFDVVYNIDENEYNGTSKLQLRIIDVKASA
jgi:single-stranded-DNA-specific exonuclease